MTETRFAGHVVRVVAIALMLLVPSLSLARGPAAGVQISGTVYYSVTPLAGVTVELRRERYDGPLFGSRTSDAGGHYKFSNVPPGDYQLMTYGPTPEYLEWQASPVTVTGVDLVLDHHLFKLLTLVSPPNNSVIATASPRFCWMGLPEAAQYRFQLNRTSDHAIVEYVHHLCDTCYTTSAVLDAGVQYTWRIEATDHEWNIIGNTSCAFRFTFVQMEHRGYLPIVLRRGG